MNISLTPQLEALVKKKVKSGLYSSASEVMRRPCACWRSATASRLFGWRNYAPKSGRVWKAASHPP